MAILRKWFCCSLETGANVMGVAQLMYGSSMLIYMLVGIQLRYKTILQEEVEPEFLIWLTSILISIIVSATLLWGVKHSKKFYLLPWLILILTSILLLFSGILYGCILLSNEKYHFLAALEMIIGLVICVFLAYCWLCVMCLYEKLNDQEQYNINNQKNEEIEFIDAGPQISTDNNPRPYRNIGQRYF